MEGGENAKRNPSRKSSKEPIKVKYISSPVLVNAKNASEFRAIVQELTGKDPPPLEGGSREVEQGKAVGGGESSGAITPPPPPSFEMNDKDGDIFSVWGRSFKGFDGS